MTTDTFFMYVDWYGQAVPILIVLVILLAFFFSARHAISSIIKQRRIEQKKGTQRLKCKLRLDFGIPSLVYAIPLLFTLFVVHDHRFSEFFLNFYQRNQGNIVVLLSAAALLIAVSPFVFLWVKFSLVLVYRQIRGFLVYTFLPLWFRYKKGIYSREEYEIFLKNCITWSKTELPNLKKLSKESYKSPLSMISFFNAKLVVKRNHTLRDFAKNELKKLQEGE